MGNPFDFFNSTATPPDPMASDRLTHPTGMDALFNPSGGGILGAMGGAMGIQSNEQRTSQVQANIMQKLTGYYEANNHSPQRAIVQLLNDPAGHDLIAMPGAQDVLDRWVKSVTPPTPSQFITPAGSNSQFSQNGSMPSNVSQPTSETQNYNSGVPSTQNTPAGTDTTQTQKGPNGAPVTTNTIQGRGQIANQGPGGNSTVIGPDGKPVSTISGQPQLGNTPAAGQTNAYGPDGRPIAGSNVAQPPVEGQMLSQVAGMIGKNITPDQLSALAVSLASPNGQATRAMAIANLPIPQAEKDKFNSNTYQIVEGMDSVGQPNGMRMIYDATTHKVMPLVPGADPGSVTVPSSVPGAQPHTIPPQAYKVDPATGQKYVDQSYLTGLDYMGLGAGVPNKIMDLAGIGIRQLDPSNNEFNSQLAGIRHAQFDHLEISLASMGARRNSRIRALSDLWQESMPSKWTDPIDAYNHMEVLHNRIDTLYASSKAIYENTTNPRLDRTEAKDDMDAMNNVRSAMPTMPAIKQMQHDIHVGKAPVTTLGGAISSVANGIGEAFGKLTGGTPNQQQTGKPLPPNGTFAPASDYNAQQQQQGTNTDAVKSMDAGALDSYERGLPKGPSPERDAVIARAKALGAGKKSKPTTGQGNPPAANPPVSGQSNYDMQPANPQGKSATPPLNAWLQNPAGERNILYKGPNDTIEGAKYGDDGNWHVQREGKWYTIVPISGKKTKSQSMGSNEKVMQ